MEFFDIISSHKHKFHNRSPTIQLYAVWIGITALISCIYGVTVYHIPQHIVGDICKYMFFVHSLHVPDSDDLYILLNNMILQWSMSPGSQYCYYPGTPSCRLVPCHVVKTLQLTCRSVLVDFIYRCPIFS